MAILDNGPFTLVLSDILEGMVLCALVKWVACDAKVGHGRRTHQHCGKQQQA
tara:strand:- start:81 stop:236 length:156 start_codon:yes stop_codon:yes gene_type:complete